MGTNYYLERDVCSACNRPAERLHIGKSSAGWCFSLHVMPTDGICGLADWERLWSEPGTRIVNEYGEPISPEDMRAWIADRGRDDAAPADFDWRNNSAEPGPRNLIRHRIDRYCIGHGDGTWDLIVGEFS